MTDWLKEELIRLGWEWDEEDRYFTKPTGQFSREDPPCPYIATIEFDEFGRTLVCDDGIELLLSGADQTLETRVEELERALKQAIDRGNFEFAFIAGTRRQVLTAEASGSWASSRTPDLAKYIREQQQ